MFLYLSCLTPVGIANKNLGTVVSPFGAEAASAAKYFCFHLTVNDLLSPLGAISAEFDLFTETS